jgi:hypothetical protein
MPAGLMNDQEATFLDGIKGLCDNIGGSELTTGITGWTKEFTVFSNPELTLTHWA